MVDARVKEWRAKFSKLQGGKEIVSLTGETSADLRLLEKGDVIVCTPTQVCTLLFLDDLDIVTDFVSVGHPFQTVATTQECAKYWAPYCRRSTARWG